MALTAPETHIREHLEFLYGRPEADRLWPDFQQRLRHFRQRNRQLAAAAPSLTQRDAFLITYGDQISEPGRPPLQTLHDFLNTHLSDALNGVHVLPHFPYSSDDGFSVIDYRAVDPALGSWDDIDALGKNYRLMFDGVINHISQHSAWFQGFRRGAAPYTDYFITCAPDTDLTQVVRPRALPLLTPVATTHGRKHVWTTFSDDQIDLNFKNPQVLLEIVDVLLFYAEHGATVIRLDAIAYLWKEIGTSCIHLPQTHRVVKLLRSVFDAVAPSMVLITETNVPHPDNISYFGNGADEAQMVYNFALPPLVLHTFHTGTAGALTRWAATLSTPSPATTFFNFLASHDGIGVMPARGLLTPEEITALVEKTKAHGGQVSVKANSDGTASPYELNITLFDALNDPGQPHAALDVQRFLASQAIMLSLAGVPGIYAHSLFGTRNWHAGHAQTHRARTLNRHKLERAPLEAELADPTSLKHRVFAGYRQLLKARQAHPAFHPQSPQRVLALPESVFGLARGTDLLALVNVTAQPVTVELPGNRPRRDLLTGRAFDATAKLAPYEYVWLAG